MLNNNCSFNFVIFCSTSLVYLWSDSFRKINWDDDIDIFLNKNSCCHILRNAFSQSYETVNG